MHILIFPVKNLGKKAHIIYNKNVVSPQNKGLSRFLWPPQALATTALAILAHAFLPHLIKTCSLP